jgi:NAD(P)-dependent dehydrogenase (short-subunit alcohol dehydrogenase family)
MNVLITGMNRGLGKALKTVFEANGDRVVGSRRDELGDLRYYDTILRLRKLVEAAGLDVLVNNAGIYSEFGIRRTNPDDIRQIIEVNLVAPMLLTRELWPVLMMNGGAVVFINSMAGRMREAGEIAYRASKFGLTGFAASLFYAGQRDGVRVVDIPFGGMNTDMLRHRPGMADNPMLQPSEAAKIVLRILNGEHPGKISHPLLQGRVIDSLSQQNIGEL